MGLGLGISRSIVQSHGGRLTLDPSFQDGARFSIELLRVDAQRRRLDQPMA
jgi:signal transduction histidine kinase